MKNTTLDLRSYYFRPDDKLFFDANIWLFIYGPQRKPDDFQVRQYSSAFSKAIHNHCQIFIDDLVLSEFINRYSRLEFSRINKESIGNYKTFKQFRNSPHFPAVAKAVASELRRLFKFSIQVNNGFDTLDIQELILDYELAESDINDQIIANLCRYKDFLFVTDDGDFKDKGLHIATVNQKLLE